MTTQIMAPAAAVEELVSAKVISARLGIPIRSLLLLRKQGKIPGVVVNKKIIRFSLRQVAQALGLQVTEAGK